MENVLACRAVRHAAFLVALLAASLAAGACASAGSGGPCELGFITTLHLGRSIEGGGTVDDAAWTQFVDEVVVPRFPDGFTVLRGEGAWRSAPDAPTQHETSFVLQIVRCDTKESEAALKEVAAAYAERFHQQAVLRTDSRTRIWW